MQVSRLFSAMLLTVGLACMAVSGAPKQTGRPLPEVEIPQTGGTKIDLKKFHGKTIVLALVSLDCQHCLETTATLQKIQIEYASRNVQVVVGATEDKPYETIPEYVKKNSPKFPMGMVDPPLFMKLAAIGPEVRPVVPVLIVADSTGIIRYQYFGDAPEMKKTEQTIRKILDELLKPPAAKAAPKNKQ